MQDPELKKALNTSNLIFLVVGFSSIGVAALLHTQFPVDFPFYRVVALGCSFAGFAVAFLLAWIDHRYGNKYLAEGLRKPALWFVLICGLGGSYASAGSAEQLARAAGNDFDGFEFVLRIVVGGFLPVIVAGLISITYWPGYEVTPSSRDKETPVNTSEDSDEKA